MIKKISRFIKNYGLRKLCYHIRVNFISRFYFSGEVQKGHNQLYAYKYLKKYLYAINNKTISGSGEDRSNTIWMLWLQGIENAPDIVQRCVESVRRYSCPDYHVVVLDSSTLPEYIDLPDFVMEKYKLGIINNALYSDLIRLALLIKYGGIWVDATCFFTDKIPSYISGSPVFCYQADKLGGGIIKASSWFIKSERENPLWINVQNILYEYLRKEKDIINYYIFHLAISLVVDCDKRSGEIWNAIPYVCNMNPHVLQFHLSEPFNPDYWEYIRSVSTVHKLTYKIPAEEQEKRGTYLDRIVL